MSIAVVWLKRDLRLTDHQALKWAAESGLPVVMLYCFEPTLLQDQHYSPRHWDFVAQSLQDIQTRLPQAALLTVKSEVIPTLQQLHQAFHISLITSHQEVGLDKTFSRDKAVALWCEEQKITWLEAPYSAVIRGKKNRVGWDQHWQSVMRAPTADVNIHQINWFQFSEQRNEKSQTVLAEFITNSAGQRGGEQQAWAVVNSFFTERGQSYAFKLSSPQHSQVHCTRLSSYLAWGNISLRQVYQTLLKYWNQPGWRRSLVALSSRLHWHCHFIQKFESEAEMEFRAVNLAYEALPRVTGEIAEQRLEAWQQGKTGIPMVDACMRCVNATGYLNFRMRAMLVSFLCHHLELDWRLGVTHLARAFLDFEPGIHYSQFQMQAGVTGINTIRIYNPVKQGQEKDPEAEFIKQWVPELQAIPNTLAHVPWQLTPMEQVMFGLELSRDYPEPIVDVEESYKKAQQLLWSWRNKPAVVSEKFRILQRHVRPQ